MTENFTVQSETWLCVGCSGHNRSGEYVALWLKIYSILALADVTGELQYPCSLAVFGEGFLSVLSCQYE